MIHIYSYLFNPLSQVQGISSHVNFCWGHPTLRGGTRGGGAEHLLLGGLGGNQPLSCGQSYGGEAAGLYGPRDVEKLWKIMKNWQMLHLLNAKDYPKDLAGAVILLQDLRLECLERSPWGLVTLQSKRWDLWKGADAISLQYPWTCCDDRTNHWLTNQIGVEIWPLTSFKF